MRHKKDRAHDCSSRAARETCKAIPYSSSTGYCLAPAGSALDGQPGAASRLPAWRAGRAGIHLGAGRGRCLAARPRLALVAASIPGPVDPRSSARRARNWSSARARPSPNCNDWPKRRALTRSSGIDATNRLALPATGRSRKLCARRACRRRAIAPRCCTSPGQSRTRLAVPSRSSHRSGGPAWPLTCQPSHCPPRAV